MDKSRLKVVSLHKGKKLATRTCALFELFPEPIFVLNKSGGIFRVNKAALKAYGYTRKELQAMKIAQLYAKQEAEVLPSNSSKEIMHRRKDGSLFPVETRCYPLGFCRRGKLLYIAQDISKEIAAERKATAKELSLKLILENVPVGIGVYDHTGKLIECNAALEAMLGYDKAKLKQMGWWEYTHPDNVLACEKWKNYFLKASTKKCKMEQRYVKTDGSVIWVSISAVKYPYGKANNYIVVVEDITDRKNVEQLLKGGNKTPSNVVLFGKQSVLIEALTYILQSTRELNLLGRVASFEDCCSLLESSNIDLVLVDEETAGQNITRISKKLAVKHSNVKIAILGLSEGQPDEYGHLPYIRLQNYSYLELVRKIKSLINTEKTFLTPTPLAETTKSNLLDLLTERERQVLHLLSAGKTNKEIGKEIHLSHSTVRNYVSAILRKLNLPNRTAAAAFFNTHKE